MTGNQVLAGTFAVLGASIVLDHGSFLLRGLASRDWLPAEGRILDATALTSTVNAAPRGQWYPSGIRIAYEYTVAGRRYTGRRSSWRGYAPRLATVLRLARQYQPGRRVTVWYNPAAPNEAVLDRGAGIGTAVGLVVGLAICAASVNWLLGLGAA